jgi:putative tryptophan/tyrosine transport system substrate-binding protein
MDRRAALVMLSTIGVSLSLGVRAQKAQLPVIGFLSSASPDLYSDRVLTFRQGLKEAGYLEGQNVEIVYRWAEGQNERLPVLAADLVQHHVAVIVAAGGTPSALAAKAATTTIPIVFGVGADPIKTGLVVSLNRPGGNLTGITNLNTDVGPKRLELLHELLPRATVFAVLVDPTSPTVSDAFSRDVQASARSLGLQLHVLNASKERDFDTVFSTLMQLRASALIIAPATFLTAESKRLAALTVRYAIPAISQFRPFVTAGGLMSYGASDTEYYRLVGSYAGRILKGEKPGDLPVQQSTKVELVINLKTARALGIKIPQSLVARADEVIE